MLQHLMDSELIDFVEQQEHSSPVEIVLAERLRAAHEELARLVRDVQRLALALETHVMEPAYG